MWKNDEPIRRISDGRAQFHPMDVLNSILPITAIVAIILFAIKEGMEFYRRWGADSRQVQAFKVLLARECELNHFVLLRLRSNLHVVREDLAEGRPQNHRLKTNVRGTLLFEYGDRESDVSSWGVSGLTEARSERMSELMLDVATLNQKLFASLEAAYDAVLNLEHLRSSLIEYNEPTSEDYKSEELYDGFIDYALRAIEDDLLALKNLYRDCTGLELKDARVR